MNKLGDKFISGQIINLDCEPIEKLEKLATDLRIKEDNIMFRKFWPNVIVKLIMKFYVKCYDVYGE